MKMEEHEVMCEAMRDHIRDMRAMVANCGGHSKITKSISHQIMLKKMYVKAIQERLFNETIDYAKDCT